MKKKEEKPKAKIVTAKEQKKAAKEEKPKRKKVDYDAHMKGMPAFTQPELAPHKILIVNFQDAEAVHKFAKLVGQLITDKTRYIWYPELPNEVALDKRWSK
jgi:hypothetical protein